MSEIRVNNPAEAQYLIEEGFDGRKVQPLPSFGAFWLFENTVALRQAMVEYIDNTFCKMDNELVGKRH